MHRALGSYKSWFVTVWNREDIPDKGTEARSLMTSRRIWIWRKWLYLGLEWKQEPDASRGVWTVSWKQWGVTENFLSRKVSQWACILGSPLCRQWRGKVGNVDWHPENHWRGFHCNRLLYLPPFLLSKSLPPPKVDYSSVSRSSFHQSGLTSSHQSHQWLSPKPVLVSLDLSDALAQLSLIWLETYFLCFFIHSDEYFWAWQTVFWEDSGKHMYKECCICGIGRTGYFYQANLPEAQ